MNNEFPKYPTDFIALTRPFTEDETQKIMSLSPDDFKFLIETLKIREVNVQKSLDKIRFRIANMMDQRNIELKKEMDEVGDSSIVSILKNELDLLNDIL